MPLVHHELCFGCGRTNLFGLMLDVERIGPETVAGRCFIKQDHQGADRGTAHQGVIAAALAEAMALAHGLDARPSGIEVAFSANAPVGTFLSIEAGTDREGAWATASAQTGEVARARGTFSL